MRRFVYLIVFAIAFLVFKAFFLDDYLKKNNSDLNTTEQTVETPPAAVAEPTPAPAPVAEKNESAPTTQQKFKKESEQSVLDEGVDWMADKLSQKLPSSQR